MDVKRRTRHLEQQIAYRTLHCHTHIYMGSNSNFIQPNSQAKCAAAVYARDCFDDEGPT